MPEHWRADVAGLVVIRPLLRWRSITSLESSHRQRVGRSTESVQAATARAARGFVERNDVDVGRSESENRRQHGQCEGGRRH